MQVQDQNNHTDEFAVVNSFLSQTVFVENYYFNKFPLVYIKESSGKAAALSAYKYAFNERNWKIGSSHHVRQDTEQWPLDSLQIEKFFQIVNDEKTDEWKHSDFAIENIDSISLGSIRESIKKEKYLVEPAKKIFFLSRPLFLDEKKAIMFFYIGSSELGFNTFDRFAVLMVKLDGRWEIGSRYYDGVMF
ncbi:MAG: hypothetical protein IR153_10115 [Flavobacterium sp.]|nr:hypothetical protein [Flavobacterium sp.]